MKTCTHPSCERRARGRDLDTGAVLCARHLRRGALRPGRFTTQTTTPTTETRTT